MSKLVDRGMLYVLGSCIYFSRVLTMSTWDPVCILACSGFSLKGARTSPEVAMVCPAGPVVYANREPGGQGKPQTHPFCTAETDELTGLPNHSIAICAHMPSEDYLQLQFRTKVQNFNLMIPENPLGFQRNRPVIKKSNNKTTTSNICIIKALGGGRLLSVRESIWLPDDSTILINCVKFTTNNLRTITATISWSV